MQRKNTLRCRHGKTSAAGGRNSLLLPGRSGGTVTPFFHKLKSPEKNGMTAVSPVEVAKAAVRREYSLRRKSLDAESRRQYDADICAQICALPSFQETECVAGFIRHGAEPDLSPLFKGKRLFLPRFDAERGVYEIVAVNDLELDLLPGKYNI
ncbi:MAG: hypothetical protein E7041_05340, partial [Lentisphaerae bacterium]|nr:hypothetical protein [Lentisphaerota bacterium]